MRITPEALKEYARTDDRFKSQDIDRLIRRTYRFCGEMTRWALTTVFGQATDEMVMHCILLHAEQPAIKPEAMHAEIERAFPFLGLR